MRSLRTKKAFTSAPAARAAHATGSAPMVRPAHRGRPQAAGLTRHELSEGEEALRPEDRALGVHVVVGLQAAGQRDLADHQRVLAQLGRQPASRIGHRTEELIQGFRSRTRVPMLVELWPSLVEDPRRDRGLDRRGLLRLLRGGPDAEGSENQVRNLQDDGTKARSDAVIDQPSPPARIERSASRTTLERARADRRRQRRARRPPSPASSSRTMSWVERFGRPAIGLLLYGRLRLLLANVAPQRPARGRGLARGARVAPATRPSAQLSCFSRTLSYAQDSYKRRIPAPPGGGTGDPKRPRPQGRIAAKSAA